MARSVGLLAAALSGGFGCSAVVDGDRFRGQTSDDAGVPRDGGYPRYVGPRDAGDPNRDGGPYDAGRDGGDDRDAGSHDAGPRDVGPIIDGGVALTILPSRLPEGMGVDVAVPIMIEGSNFTAGVSVFARGPAPVTIVTESMVVTPTRIAVEVRVPVDSTMDTGISMIEIVARESSPPTDSIGTLEIEHLPELIVGGATPAMTPADLAPLYSWIEVPLGETLDLDGPLGTPAILRATSRIDMHGTITAAASADAEPAGCPAVSGTSGSCGARDGAIGAPKTVGRGGGGGGGSAMSGFNAGMTNATLGLGGDAHGWPWLSTLAEAGGGGGARGGAAGGDGGGVVALRTPGTLAVSGTIDVGGASGTEATTGVSCADRSGGGGGGGGGSVLLSGRALASTVFTLSVLGGDGGGDRSCSGLEGGAGARGRTRLDAPVVLPTYTVLPGTNLETDRRGPMFVADAPVIQTSGTFTMSFVGSNETGMGYPWSIDGTVQTTRILASGGMGELSVVSPVGLHRICIGVATSGTMTEEGQNCIDVAVIF